MQKLLQESMDETSIAYSSPKLAVALGRVVFIIVEQYSGTAN